ncbi:MAG: DUF3427 domain-containing protein [Acidobacteria bacterium]|nr:DUF3427 domain-containing protein [Acidobacteriota bacterium]
MLNFKVGRRYSRRAVQRAAGTEGKGGVWFNGVVPPAAARDFIIFATVGDAGRTGHDYANRWERDCLRWYHQKRSRLKWPGVRELLHSGVPIHVFWRISNKDPLFTYAGRATASEVKDTTPVEILWSF